MTDIDHDAHTLLGFAPLDPEPTGSAEALAWSGEDEVLDYPETAPTLVLGGRKAPLAVIVAVLVAVVVSLGWVATKGVGSPASPAPIAAPMTTVATSVAPPPSPAPTATVTVQAAAPVLPTYDPSPSDPAWPTDPRFNYGSALPHTDPRFSYDVVAGGPCGMQTEEFGYTTEASGNGAIAVCSHATWTWVLDQFNMIHSRGSRCDSGDDSGIAMSLEGRQLTCVTGASGIGTWQTG